MPADPFMIGMGALAGDGRFSLGFAIALAWSAAMAGDLLWYRIGRRWGHGALRLLCRISIEPDSCVRTATGRFVKHGSKSLVIAKFVPGLSAVATPVAGMIRTPMRDFLFWNGLGSLIWVSVYLTVGFLFRKRLQALAEFVERFSKTLIILAVGAALLYLLWKFWRRRQFLLGVAARAITPEELRDRMGRSEPLVVVDLRDRLDVASDPVRVPGALVRPPAELLQSYSELPEDREIILYCNCPNDGSSGKTSMDLRRLGLRNVRPLSGGLDGWRERGFPTEGIPEMMVQL